MSVASSRWLALVMCLLAPHTLPFAWAVVLQGNPSRLALELTHQITLRPGRGEPAFPLNATSFCVLTSAGGYTIGLPTAQPLDQSGSPAGGGVLRKNLMNGLLVLPASTIDGSRINCTVPSFGSAGNTSLCVAFGQVDPWGPAPPPNVCNNTNHTQPAYFERFALFSPQFGRRPYFHEDNGTLVVMTDRSLRGTSLTLSATINNSVQIRAAINGGDNVSIPFSLAGLPSHVQEDVVISISGMPGLPEDVCATHTRRFLRAPPPAAGSGVIAWQVDHTTKGLRVDGVPFVARGWFGSGGLHESAGLPPRLVNPALSLEELQVLSTASVTTEWSRQGHTFVKASFLPIDGDNFTQV